MGKGQDQVDLGNERIKDMQRDVERRNQEQSQGKNK